MNYTWYCRHITPRKVTEVSKHIKLYYNYKILQKQYRNDGGSLDYLTIARPRHGPESHLEVAPVNQ